MEEQNPYRFYIVDDDRVHNEKMRRLLEAEGYRVATAESSRRALEELPKDPPDCLLLDMMMPEIDGLQLLKRLRGDRAFDGVKIVVVSGKSYEFDRQRAISFGADGYLTKPVDPEEIVAKLQRILEDRITLAFWGVHGTLPAPGPGTVRYGGNTSCVSMSFPKGQFFVFDAGSGIKVLSSHLLATQPPPFSATIFISHPHWDHINALPFFVPLYMQGNEFELCGPAHGDIDIRGLLSAQMDGVYFPIRLKEFGATLSFRDLGEEVFEKDGLRVRTMLLNHPGNCLGYRVEYRGRSLCYVTDNELYPPETPFFNEHYRDRLARFVEAADVLITDTTYTDEEYPAKIHWGHSSVSQVADLAARGSVKNLYLFHHDPDHDDDTVDRKHEQVQEWLRRNGSDTVCIAPHEGMEVRL